MRLNPLNLIDFYKADHRSQYPEGTDVVFTNGTFRTSRIAGIEAVVHAGLSYYLQEFLVDVWNQGFFDLPKQDVLARYDRRMKNAGISITTEHIAELWDYGRLPIEVWSLPEGSIVPIGVPPFVLWNTDKRFSWIVNYLETSLSASYWQIATSATIAHRYRKLFDDVARITGGAPEFTQWQGHDFSFRGMSSIESAIMSAAGHLMSFTGTDTVPAIDFLEDYYFANSDTELIGGSVPATEHSVMCMGQKESERETYRRLITEVYPNGPVSIVSDTWDYWKVWTEVLPSLKDEILARNDGPVVVRPDSGDPVKIIVGDPTAPVGSPAHKGTFELAWELLGGTVTEQGFKLLDPHIGAIYGDSITYERAEQIAYGLIGKGFVPSLVLGIGSFTYQYNTRDTFGFAMKATYGEVKGEPREIFKDPATDNGTKKSAKGLLAVYESDGQYVLQQGATWGQVRNCAYEQVFHEGDLTNLPSLADIRARLEAARS
jgi:nicotinamide phosphoribosyltransferase